MIIGSENDARLKNKRLSAGRESRANKFNFIIFRNYDGTPTSRTMTREMYNKLFPDTCSS